MRVLVIGEPCIDVIHKADGKIYNEIGGISYSVVASGMLDDGIETVPLIGLTPADRGDFEKLFGRLASVDMSGIYDPGSPARRVDLFYEDENRRWECSTQPINPTPFERIAPFLPAEGIHLNFISGNDVALDTLRKMRSHAPACHIHFDLHNIVMRHEPDGKRFRQPRKDYLDWADCADTIQLNEDEANIIDDEVHDYGELAKKILGTKAKGLIISLAEKGLRLYEKTGGEIREHFLPAEKVNVVDPTGSGDVFGATFLHRILTGGSYVEAASAGVEMAARKASVAGPSGLLSLKRSGSGD